MFAWLFPLVKEIRSRVSGKLHFRRWRIIELPWFRVYLHCIEESDQDAHQHNHPWNYLSLILRGGYVEHSTKWDLEGKPLAWRTKFCTPGMFVRHSRSDTHKLSVIVKPTWTLVMCFGKHNVWGYRTEAGFVDHITYRKLKNEGALQ